MGSGKKEAARKVRQGKTGDGMSNVKTKGENFYRSAKKVKTLNILKSGKPTRNAQGDITQTAAFQGREKPAARVEPNRKWFTNTRVISQDSLSKFREAVESQQKDPYSYLLKQNKIPLSLINDGKDKERKDGVVQHAAKRKVEVESFADTFGPNARRKRPKMMAGSLEDLAAATSNTQTSYEKRQEEDRLASGGILSQTADDIAAVGETRDGVLGTALEPIFNKGQSKRIWNELYKVIDSSDVVLHVLDARDPLGTRCRSVEKYIRTEAPHKHLVFILNKTDLVPTSVAARWVKLLSREYPALAFHASMTNSFGKGTLISLLRQFSALHSSRKQISVGFIGYPNTGKSSIINTLRAKKVCTTAPVPGETKVWQYVTLMKRIYLIDCPGIVPPSITDTPEEILLRGSVRVENIEYPSQYIPAVLKACQARHIERTYDFKLKTHEDKGEVDAIAFLEQLARKSGKLLKGGEADLDTVAKSVLNDFLRGKIPWFVPPPVGEGKEGGEEVAISEKGRDSSLGLKRKREMNDVEVENGTALEDVADTDEAETEGFEGFEGEDGSVEEDADDETLELVAPDAELQALEDLEDSGESVSSGKA